MAEEIFGSILNVMTFRMPEEAFERTLRWWGEAPDEPGLGKFVVTEAREDARPTSVIYQSTSGQRLCL
jgi:acyl-CoA reductase-like NAD-dependent aldehyde dehydrogenase